MNDKSEQLTADLSILIEQDQPLKKSEILYYLNLFLNNQVSIQTISNRKVFVFNGSNDKKIIMLTSNITYLGGNKNHPIFKKRIQLKKWYKEFVLNNQKEYDIRFMGIYHFNGFVIFADFLKDSYLNKKMNNSAAHIYMNDLYQGTINGVFCKIDINENKINVIANRSLLDYFEKNIFSNQDRSTLNEFQNFNDSYGLFKDWIYAKNAIVEMYENKWPPWKQAEWPGFYLEFKLNQFINQTDSKNIILYTNKARHNFEYNFDLYFCNEDFYGDLKASDLKQKYSPGNDQNEFIKCINQKNKFWYVIYEHETIKDKDSNSNFSTTRFWNNIKQIDFKNILNPYKLNKTTDDDLKHIEIESLSYKDRMKHKVLFKRMFVIEFNRINFRQGLMIFNQGKQQDGSKRNPKFIINKSNIDNFVIYRYSKENDEKI